MALNSSTPAPATGQVTGGVADLRIFIFGLFFIFGGITSLNDVLIPKLKHLFTLSYGEVMLVQSAFFLGYFLVSLPAAALVRRLGFMRTTVVGLLTMTAGCLLFIPASSSGMFVAFLGALFVLASGITIVQVVANPLISLLGPPASAPARLTFAQAFNSLGTTVFPYFGAIIILGSLPVVDETRLTGAALAAYRAQETRVIDQTYLGIAVALLVVAALVWIRRNRLREELPPPGGNVLAAFDLLRRPRFAFGTLGIFLYVGAEVAIGSLLVNYLMQRDTMGLTAQTAGELVAFYWGGAMVGRFIGAALMRRVAPSTVLLCAAIGTMTLLAVSGLTSGTISGVALIGIGLFNSIMFPTIFSLASAGLGPRAAEGSGIICMAIVGGAVIPLLVGFAADATSLRGALLVPALCYAGIALFGRYCGAHPVAGVETNAGAPAVA
ncbi:sugar MFS transporter [Glacieibacterium frigidum]|uniref:Sugar MFS transporter n=1 Tax=Glacieibacterium frigidum TaxID=2593303 RepID=A0A552UJF2_9SPHN|nr:sugar MFS transporter [Glacieibacterium frigidum]TRW18358.1 sugar MFS transporter [Glacieibacterium frigidum]